MTDSSLRILHLVSYPLYSGPIPSTVGLALAQRRLGHRVWLGYDTKRGAFNDFEEAAEPRLAGLELKPPVAMTLSAKSTLRELFCDRRTLRDTLRREAIDILHVHLSHDHVMAIAAGAHRRVKVIRTFHAARSLERRLGQGWINRRASGWIVRSAAHQERLCDHFGVPRDRARTIPGGIDAEAFSPASLAVRTAARRRFGIPEGARLLVHVALIAYRGQEELAGALVRVNSANLHVLFVGRGECEEALKLLVKGIGLEGKAHFSGYLKGPELLEAYAAADAAFLAQAGNDASARAALEAMGCGLPVVAVARDSLGDLVTADVGYPVAARSPEAIAEALRVWLADNRRAEKGQAARERVIRERSFAGEAEQTLELYRQVLGSP